MATIQLYHSVILNTSQLKKGQNRIPISHDKSPGLHHVQSLRNFGYGEAYEHGEHGDALCDVLQLLPKDSLSHFEYVYLMRKPTCQP